jgi:hypothetical protein
MADDRKPDTSNFVEHLRLVHVTLVLTCLVSVVAVLSQDESSAKRASQQLESLIRVQDAWDGGNWITRATSQRTPPSYLGSIKSDNQTKRWRFVPSVAYVRKDGTSVKRPGGKSIFDKQETKSDFVDLAHAKVIWDALRDVTEFVVPTGIHDGWHVSWTTPAPQPSPVDVHVDLDTPSQHNTGVQAPTPEQTIAMEASWHLKADITDSALLNMTRARSDDSYFTSSLFLPMPIAIGDRRFFQDAWAFPAVTQKTVVNLLKELKEQAKVEDLPVGSFQDAFPDLTELSKYLTEVPFEKLRSHFREETNRAADKIDVSFLKFPADELVYIGTGLILVLTLYTSAVLRDFRTRVVPGDKAWNVAWIGISNEASSIAIFWLSMILPPATALLLIAKAGRVSDGPKAAIVAGTGLAFAVILSGIFFSWSALQTAERRLPPSEPTVA